VSGILLMERSGSVHALIGDPNHPYHLAVGDEMSCKADTSRGPCPNPVKPGSSYCRQHTRDANLATAYRLSNPDLQESVEYHAKASLLDISQQIVLMRGIIERRLNMGDGSDADQISAFNFVATQLAALTKMTETLVKLSKESGELMERSQVEAYTDSVLEIVIDELKSVPGFEAIVDRIVTRLDDQEGTQDQS